MVQAERHVARSGSDVHPKRVSQRSQQPKLRIVALTIAAIIATATTGTLTSTTAALTASDVGFYAIDGSGLTVNNDNNLFVQDPANATALTIDATTLTYVADPASRLYGDANPAFIGTVTGFQNGETVATATTGTLIFTTAALTTLDVGSYAIDRSGLAANKGNYLFVQDPENATALTIDAATLSYLADPALRLYGDANPAFAGTVTGFKSGETIATATTGTLTFTTAALTTSDVGSYAIDGLGLTANNDNYVFVQDPANATALTITQRGLTVTADDQSRLYGDANPALTYQLTGGMLINGDTLSGIPATVAKIRTIGAGMRLPAGVTPDFSFDRRNANGSGVAF